MTQDFVSVITSILAGLVVCLPLVVKLVQTTKAAVEEKNWSPLLGLVVDLMEQAEEKFNDGATRKEWVMAMVQTSAEFVNYPMDTESLSAMIDSICDLTKVINAREANKA